MPGVFAGGIGESVLPVQHAYLVFLTIIGLRAPAGFLSATERDQLLPLCLLTEERERWVDEPCCMFFVRFAQQQCRKKVPGCLGL